LRVFLETDEQVWNLGRDDRIIAGKELIIKSVILRVKYVKAGKLEKGALTVLLPHPHPVVR
jgi:hypothetical protein